jgi:pimeloyl-ACP methyl ester carboxylesterase
LSHMTTADVARDMDQIRIALGAPRINYFGFSYGTYLAQVYGTLFPERIRRMVLDSNVNPRRVWYPSQLDQDVALDRNIGIWFRWISRFPGVYHLGATAKKVRKLFYRQRAKLRRHPAGGKIGPNEWSDTFLWAAYYQSTWLDLARAFSGWVHQRRWRPIKTFWDAFFTPGNDNGFAAYLGVQCSDAQWPQRWSRWARDGWRTHRRAPFFTWGNVWFNAPCLYWPAAPHRRVRVNGSGVNSALLIGERLDAATPFKGSRAVRRRFPNSSLIAVKRGTTHAGTLSGNLCVDNKIAAYLATGRRPARRSGDRADAVCKALPKPVPGGARRPSGRASGGPALDLLLRARLQHFPGP